MLTVEGCTCILHAMQVPSWNSTKSLNNNIELSWINSIFNCVRQSGKC